MSTKSDTTNAPVKRLALSRETVKNLGVRSAVKTGILLPGATDACRPVVGVTHAASCPSAVVQITNLCY